MKIAWVSRHKPLQEQIKFLREKFGDIEIVQISETFTTAEQVMQKIKQHDNIKYAVVVLPLSMIARLIELAKKENITLLWAEMETIHECEIENCREFRKESDVWLPLHRSKKGRHMRFKKFKKIKEIKMITEELD